MCRYAMTNYKAHFACMNCRKAFKRRLLIDIDGGDNKNKKEIPAKCPECNQLMADMGLDFEAPKKKDTKAWKHISTLYKVGITFHSCGCAGPGYIPKDTDELIKHFVKIKKCYLAHQHFWARRQDDPEVESEIAKDKHKNWNFLYNIPPEAKTGTKKKPTYDSAEAQKYWGKRILEIQEKIQHLSQA